MKPLRTVALLGAALWLISSAAPANARARRNAKHRKLDVSWLTKPAERAVNNAQFARAAVLYQGALSLRPNDPKLLWRLAEIFTMGGQFSLAQDTYRDWLKVGTTPAKTARAKSEIQRLATAPAPFSESDDTRKAVRQRTFAMKAVRLARGLRRRHPQQAIQYLQAALVMDSTLVGAYRLIGTIYDKLRDKTSAQAFFVKYLRLRPGGRLANMVRKRLRGNKEVARVTFQASFPCMVFINRGLLDARRKTPLKEVVLPSGEYTVVFYNREYHFGKKVRIKVQAGQAQQVKAEFGVLTVKLKPWARVRAKRVGSRDWRDLGLWETVGLPAATYLMEFRTDDGKKRMSKRIVLRPGKTIKITRWR